MPRGARLPALVLLNVGSSLLAADDSTNSPILSNLSFDQLSQIQIVTVSQRSEPLADAAAAVHVVTSQDIARSGATSIPEALRHVPGLNVAQINGSTWAVGARGFQSQFADKLLVLEDGVSVYSPVYSGVFWDSQNYFLPDVDQIEVVLGPGGSIWGANAVNGVINVVTKSARDTQGGEVYAGGGSENVAMAGARYGWQTGTNTYARVYGMYDYDSPLEKWDGGGDAHDATSSGRGGFRVDGYPQDTAQWTLKGDVLWAENQNYAIVPVMSPPSYLSTNLDDDKLFGGQLLGNWQSEINSDSTLRLQAYYDYAQRETTVVNAGVHTADLELHHTWSGWQRQVIDWGLDARMTHVDTGPAWAMFQPEHSTVWLGSGFLQDEITLLPDRLTFTAGIKLEGHSDSGFLPQPNARLTWHPAERQTLWASWSQALRSPSDVELNGIIELSYVPPGPRALQFEGNPDVQPERLQAWELGWRWNLPQPQLTLDVDGYYYQYRDLIMQTYDAAHATASLMPLETANGTQGDAYGGEVALTWRPCNQWFASANYSVRHAMLRSSAPDPLDYAGDSLSSPRQTVSLTSGIQLTRQLELTGALRYLDNIPYYNVPAYFELDLQLAWRPSAHWELAITGQNLLHDYHREYMASLVDRAAEIPRGVYAKVTWRF